MQLLRLEPPSDASVNAKRPEIAATFAEPVNPKSIRVSLDDHDVTQETYLSARSIVSDPAFDLPEGMHTVVVTGWTPAHEPFTEQWSFTTAGSAELHQRTRASQRDARTHRVYGERIHSARFRTPRDRDDERDDRYLQRSRARLDLKRRNGGRQRVLLDSHRAAVTRG